MLKSSYFWLVMAAVCGATLFHTSQRVTDGRSELAKMERETRREEESLRVLQAEWSYLNQPERLEKLAKEYLQLEPMKGRQFAKATDLDENVDQIIANNGHDLIVDGAAVVPVKEDAPAVITVSETTVTPAAVAKAPPAAPAIPAAVKAAALKAPAKPVAKTPAVKPLVAKAAPKPQPVIRYQAPVQAAAPQPRPYVRPPQPSRAYPSTAAAKPSSATAAPASRNFGDVMKSLETD